MLDSSALASETGQNLPTASLRRYQITAVGFRYSIPQEVRVYNPYNVLHFPQNRGPSSSFLHLPPPQISGFCPIHSSKPSSMTVESKSEETQMSGRAVSPPEVLATAVEDPVVVKEEKKVVLKKTTTSSTTTEGPRSKEEDDVNESKAEKKHHQHRSLAAVLVEKSSSFREESSFLSDLKESEKKALFELRAKVEEAIVENKFFKSENGEEKNVVDVTLWGVPLLPSKCAESTNVILLKFLRAREFKVEDAFLMLQRTMQWRRENNIDTILEEDSLGDRLEEAAYMDGVDRDGHPVCYNVYGVFQDEKLYQKAFGSKEKVEKFVRWRFQLMEGEIQKMDFKPGGAASILQVIDLKNAPGLSKKELRVAMKRAVEMLQDNYPEFVAKNIFINVPFWYYAISALLSPFLTKRTTSKFVFARSANVTETLLKYIPAEDIPTNYGGLRHPNDTEFTVKDGGVSELTIKAGSTENIELPAPEVGATLLWDLTVLGWEVNYKEEFAPEDEGSYTIIVQKGRRMAAQDEPVRNSFRINEPGKIVLTIENATFKKKKALFRYKTKGC